MRQDILSYVLSFSPVNTNSYIWDSLTCGQLSAQRVGETDKPFLSRTILRVHRVEVLEYIQQVSYSSTSLNRANGPRSQRQHHPGRTS